MKLSRWLGAVVVAGLLVAVPANVALAECSSTPSLETALSETSVAFVGEVTEAQFGVEDTTLRVQWIWKGGDLGADVVVRASEESGVSFRSGVSYIVIPENVRAPYELGECSGTRIYRADGELIPEHLQEAVGSISGLARQPGHSAESQEATGFPWVPIALAGGVAALGAAAVHLSRIRERPLSSTGKVSGARRGSWRRIGGPLSWSARSGARQLKRMRRFRTERDSDPPE